MPAADEIGIAVSSAVDIVIDNHVGPAALRRAGQLCMGVTLRSQQLPRHLAGRYVRLVPNSLITYSIRVLSHPAMEVRAEEQFLLALRCD